MSRHKEEKEYTGAGTYFVHSGGRSSMSGQGEMTWDELIKLRDEPVSTSSPDALLERGIAEYTFLPGQDGVLGKGKFSTVYRVLGSDDREYALKHTPLHPHHPLIAARLLREPTLLAQLPPHPCLIGVEGIVRTESHFYLIEQYASHHVPLPAHPLPLTPSRAAYILDQLVSVVRDCLHSGRVCHRDLKGENVLVDAESGDILILDLGLATQFSASNAKLTTCCGSPAFHSPEIVNALNHPPGVVTYYGPELDIWCIALILLSLLLRTRFPLGINHTQLHTMRSRVLDRLQELDEVYPPRAPWRISPSMERLTPEEKQFEASEWSRVRKAMRDFLEIDGIKRMRAFEAYELGDVMLDRLRDFELSSEVRKGFKSTSFIPEPIKYTLPLYLDPDGDPSTDCEDGESHDHYIELDNPAGLSERKTMSYLRYILRSNGVLYHCLPPRLDTADNDDDSSHAPILQLVIPLPAEGAFRQMPKHHQPKTRASASPTGEAAPEGNDANTNGWISSLLPFKRPSLGRSVSVPAKTLTQASPPPHMANKGKGKERWLKCWMKVDFITADEREGRLSTGNSASSAGNTDDETGALGLGLNGVSNSQGGTISLSKGTSGKSRSRPRKVTPNGVDGFTPLIKPAKLHEGPIVLSPLAATGPHITLPPLTEGTSESHTGRTVAHVYDGDVGITQVRRPSPRRRTTSDRSTLLREYGRDRPIAPPSPLSREVSPERLYHDGEHGSQGLMSSPPVMRRRTTSSSTHTHRSTRHRSGSRPVRGIVRLTLTDGRGYEVLRRALEVHPSQEGEARRADQPPAERNGRDSGGCRTRRSTSGASVSRLGTARTAESDPLLTPLSVSTEGDGYTQNNTTVSDPETDNSASKTRAASCGLPIFVPMSSLGISEVQQEDETDAEGGTGEEEQRGRPRSKPSPKIIYHQVQVAPAPPSASVTLLTTPSAIGGFSGDNGLGLPSLLPVSFEQNQHQQQDKVVLVAEEVVSHLGDDDDKSTKNTEARVLGVEVKPRRGASRSRDRKRGMGLLDVLFGIGVRDGGLEVEGRRAASVPPGRRV